MMSTSYFLATRDRINEENRWPKISSQTLEEAKQIKKNLFASCGPAMILILLNAIVAGCSYIRIIPALPHHILAYLVIMAQARAMRATLQFHRFREKLFEEAL
jgi:cation transport ATPase